MQGVEKGAGLEVDGEERRVYRWRRRQFLELGFGKGEAQVLAMTGADWHRAERLLGKGCSHAVAFEILT